MQVSSAASRVRESQGGVRVAKFGTALGQRVRAAAEQAAAYAERQLSKLEGSPGVHPPLPA